MGETTASPDAVNQVFAELPVAAGSMSKFSAAPIVRVQGPVELPQITITAPPTRQQGGANAGSEAGASTGGSGDKMFDRLNQQLRRKVDEVNPVINAPPLDARSPDTKIGVINIPGVQQQYGKNFGHSAFPYRPPTPVYSSPLGRR